MHVTNPPGMWCIGVSFFYIEVLCYLSPKSHVIIFKNKNAYTKSQYLKLNKLWHAFFNCAIQTHQ
jgi:hypothetical protein